MALLEAGADLNVRTNSRSDTPLHDAETAGVVMALLEAGLDPNVRNKFGQTPLHSAAVHHHY